MTSDVVNSIIQYARSLSELPFSLGDDPRIIFKHEGRCYMTDKGARFSEITAESIHDVTDEDQSQFLAERVLMDSKSLSAICGRPPTPLQLKPFIRACFTDI